MRKFLTQLKTNCAYAPALVLALSFCLAGKAHAANTQLCDLLVNGSAKSNPSAVKAAVAAGENVNALCTLNQFSQPTRTAFAHPDVLANADLALYFIDHGVNPDLVSIDRLCSHSYCSGLLSNLGFAALYSDPTVVRALLQKTQRPPQLELQFQYYLRNVTALGIAASNCRFDNVAVLLEAGANPMAVAFDLQNGTLKDTLLSITARTRDQQHASETYALNLIPNWDFSRDPLDITNDYLLDQFATRAGDNYTYFFSRPIVDALISRGADARAHVAVSSIPVQQALSGDWGRLFKRAMAASLGHEMTSIGLLPVALFAGTDYGYLLNEVKVDINEDNGALLMAAIANQQNSTILYLRGRGARFYGSHRSFMMEKGYDETFIEKVAAAGN